MKCTINEEVNNDLQQINPLLYKDDIFWKFLEIELTHGCIWPYVFKLTNTVLSNKIDAILFLKLKWECNLFSVNIGWNKSQCQIAYSYLLHFKRENYRSVNWHGMLLYKIYFLKLCTYAANLR